MTWTRLPLTPSPTQATPLAPMVNAASAALASGTSAGVVSPDGSGVDAPTAPALAATCASVGPSVVSRRGTAGSAPVGATGVTSRFTSSPAGGPSGPWEHRSGRTVRYLPTHGSPFLAGTSPPWIRPRAALGSEEHTSELQSHSHLVCRLLLEK